MASRHPLIPAVAALLAVATSLPAGADVEEARRLLDEGRAGQALRVLDEQLEGSPQDAEARFLRGLALSRTGRREEAIAVFQKLTRDYPQLPEPYNNLAVIYAQQGDYEQARDALEAALATHPSYATAHENLGDIYAALASASYNRALMLEEGNSTARDKLRVMENLSAGAPAARPTLSGGPASGGSTGSTPAAAASAPAGDGASTSSPAPAGSAPTASPQPAQASGDALATRERISAAIYDWAQAWQNQNIVAYLGAYAPDFTPAGGLSRDAWESQRRDRVGAPDTITVRIRDPEIQIVDAERARVVFTQEYDSDSYSDVTNKVLDMRRVGDRWLIIRETTR